MLSSPAILIRSLLLLLPAIVIGTVSAANAQTTPSAPAQPEVAKAVTPPASKATNAPVFTDYRGVKIGMTAEEVRSRIAGLKQGKDQDLLVFSERESAQIYYDNNGKVMAISIDYFDNSNAPTPHTVLGSSLQAKPDGSMYQLIRYPEAGYWISYNRTAGDKPIVTITMQKM